MEVVQDKIGSIEFKMLSPDMIKKMSVVKVVTPELYDADGFPIDGSLMDLRMGTIDPGLRCRTCGNKVGDCPGHFGHIELAKPVIHIKYVNVIYDLLRATCPKCGRIKLDDNEIQKAKEKIKRIVELKGEDAKWEYIANVTAKARKARSCPHCKAPAAKIKLNKPMTFIDGKKKLTPIDIRERLERIPDSDLELLGISPNAGRPEWAILTYLPVPPVTVRPSITLEDGNKSEDDLTHKLSDIVRTNQRLFENLNAGAPELIIEDLWELLQYHVTTFFTNTVSGIPPARHRSGKLLKTLEDRLKGKEGRFRAHLAGKRVNFSARTVISPDPQLKIEEVGVPYEVAKELTIPEVVTPWNKSYLKELIKRGEKYPGANYVITPEGHKKRITEETKEVILEELDVGYIVERHIVDGDLAVFNRQPSLHRLSMMGHRVKVLPGKTFRLNPCVAKPYNADYDGDEMNLHIPQTQEAISEVKYLMGVEHNLVSPRYGLPIIGSLQDHITGLALLTYKDTTVPRDIAAQLLIDSRIDKELPPGKNIKGKDIFSLLLPDDFEFEGYAHTCRKCVKCDPQNCPYDSYIKIKKGKLISGVIDSSSLGGGKGKLLQKLYRDYGPEVTSEFLYKASLLGINYLTLRGFSAYISDTDLPPKAVEEIKEKLNEAEAKVKELVARYNSGRLRAYPGRTLRETLEIKINETLNKVRNQTARLIEKFSDFNNPSWAMVEFGSKGDPLNMEFMMAFVGQMNLRGQRINKGYEGRTLPHFKEGDLGTTANGFIRHGYKAGMTPVEFYFQAISGRDALMDTSIRTPKSGYLQRRILNALQDLKVNKDLTVRDASGKIIQFMYGEDGVDVSKSDGGEVVIGE